MSLNETPSANRLHIGFFGRRNSGKSSLVNALAGQELMIVSDIKGTTTDPVSKAMEIHGLGACVLTDTAGFDDDAGELGRLRVEKTRLAAEKTDIAVLLFSSEDIHLELSWYQMFQEKKTPVLCVVSRADCDIQKVSNAVFSKIGVKPIQVSPFDKASAEVLRQALCRMLPEDFEQPSITGALIKKGDTVMLVMPQDIQAPRGRLILPQVQTIRDLLDNRATVVCTTTDQMTNALQALSEPPGLIITDSQVFKEVYQNKPKQSRLTSFSVLFAALKGDLEYYLESVKAIPQLNEKSCVLIAECCAHAPMNEDIGRVKIPRILRRLAGEEIKIDVAGGTDFPQDLTKYDLIIQCGACMFNRKYVLSRIERAKKQQIPMTNYGIFLAHAAGILDKISL